MTLLHICSLGSSPEANISNTHAGMAACMRSLGSFNPIHERITNIGKEFTWRKEPTIIQRGVFSTKERCDILKL